MITDARLSRALHLLLHLADLGSPATSESLARALNTHPVVVRRILAGLRERGYVRAEKGRGGGWSLACEPAKVTLLEIYIALGRPALLAIGHRSEGTDCRVEQAVNHALAGAFRDAEARLLARLGELTLAALRADMHASRAAHGGCPFQPGSPSLAPVPC